MGYIVCVSGSFVLLCKINKWLGLEFIKRNKVYNLKKNIDLFFVYICLFVILFLIGELILYLLCLL